MVWPVLLRILKRQDWAEEILQESFIQIWQHAHYYHPERGDPLAWMISIARYRAMDFKRKSNTDNQTIPSEPIDNLLQIDLQNALNYCLEQLDQASRRALVLSYYEGYTHKELSKQLVQPLGTVKSWIRRGFYKLKHCLESDND